MVPDPLQEGVRHLESHREELDKTVWANERLAQEHEVPFIDLWDSIRGAADNSIPMKRFGFRELRLGLPKSPETLKNEVIVTRFSSGGDILDHASWGKWLDDLRNQGYRLSQCEFHHSQFTPRKEGSTSTMQSVFHVVNDRTGGRWILKGPLQVQWAAPAGPGSRLEIVSMDASGMVMYFRGGQPAFSETPLNPVLKRGGASRLLVYDVDRDGDSDLAMLSDNRFLRNRGDGTFDASPLLSRPGQDVTTGIIADVTGEGIADLVQSEGKFLVLHRGMPNGTFSDGQPIAGPSPDLSGCAFTAGDVNADGSLDLFIARYRNPYFGGQLPTPYFDADDGYAAHLLINDGFGGFSDGTELSGLSGKKIHRRTYGASLIDLDDDGDLDLLVVSDFSGIDIYANDGKGRFTDVTATAVDERSLFGMSHCFADLDKDGRSDIFVTGMSSTTARRLEGLGLGRKEFPQHDEMRAKMSYGNRVYCKGDGFSYKQPQFKDDVARTGWSWGVVPIDFDCDGDIDLYIANGHSSRKTAKDYCTTYWCHDIYSGTSQYDPVLNLGFQKNFSKGISWNGFEHNVLFMNSGGTSFHNVSFLMDTSLEEDCRSVITDDLDGDGRMDLIIEEDLAIPEANNGHYRILMNRWKGQNHWLGIRLREEGKGISPMGATITVDTAAGRLVHKVTSGDTFRSQHAPNAHFGLGSTDQVRLITVRWLNGHERTITDPAIDRYHDIRP